MTRGPNRRKPRKNVWCHGRTFLSNLIQQIPRIASKAPYEVLRGEKNYILILFFIISSHLKPMKL